MTPFLFGKLPAHGDFVFRGLADAGREAWDAWGSAVLDMLRARTGEGFEEAHGAAPPWRFVAPSADGWRAGAVAPSVDGAGRRYLLAVGIDALTPAQAGAVGLAYADVAEGLIYEGLAQGFSADTLFTLAAEGFADVAAATDGAARTLAAAPRGAGAWWTLGSPTCVPAVISTDQAPHDLFARTVSAAASPLPVLSLEPTP